MLHGSVEGLAPEEALEAVLPTAGLHAVRDRERVVVGEDSRGRRTA